MNLSHGQAPYVDYESVSGWYRFVERDSGGYRTYAAYRLIDGEQVYQQDIQLDDDGQPTAADLYRATPKDCV